MGWHWHLLLRVESRQRAWAIMRHLFSRNEQRQFREHRAGHIIEHCKNGGIELTIEPLIAVSDHLPLNEEVRPCSAG